LNASILICLSVNGLHRFAQIFIAYINRFMYSCAMNKYAQALGRRAKGVPKEITEADRERRRQWAAGMSKRRWAKVRAQKKNKSK
jgi:hypothetical protein